MQHYAFVVFGAVIALFGLWQLVARIRFLARSTAVTGHFVAWDVKTPGKGGAPASSDGRRSYRPIVAFRTADGKEHRVTGTVYTRSYSATGEAKGATYPVRHDAANPADARVVTFKDFWLLPIATLAVGIFVIAVVAKG